jgi:hypothetical protein
LNRPNNVAYGCDDFHLKPAFDSASFKSFDTPRIKLLHIGVGGPTDRLDGVGVAC